MTQTSQAPLQAIIRPGVEIDRNQEVVDLALFDEDGNNFFLPEEFDPENLPAFPVGEPVVTAGFPLDEFRQVSSEKSALVIASFQQPRGSGEALSAQLEVNISPTNQYNDRVTLYYIGSNLGTEAYARTHRFNTQFFLPVGWWWHIAIVGDPGVYNNKCIEQTLG